MTTRAVVLPATPLLVPGAAGAGEVLVPTRQDVVAALRTLARDADRVVVLACGAPGSGVVRGAAHPTLAAAGISDERIAARWPAPSGARPAGDAGTATGADTRGAAGVGVGGRRPAGVGASVALLALAAVGAPVPADVIEVEMDGATTGRPDADGASGSAPADERTGSPADERADARPGRALQGLGRALREDGSALVVAADPRAAALETVLGGFVDPAWRVERAVSRGEYEDRPYEVLRFVSA